VTEKDPDFETLVASLKGKTVPFDQYLEATKQSPALAEIYENMLKRRIINANDKQELRNLLISAVNPDVRWVDYAPTDTSMRHASKVLIGAHRMGLFGRTSEAGSHHEDEEKKLSDHEVDSHKPTTPKGSSSGP
jgi:hypothetical protein